MFPLSTAIPGLVWAYRFLPAEARVERLAAEVAATDLMAGEGFVWLHLNLADSRVPPFLEQFAGLNAEALMALTTPRHPCGPDG